MNGCVLLDDDQARATKIQVPAKISTRRARETGDFP